MILALYPSKDAPDFAYIAKVAKRVGGFSRLAQLAWLSGAYRVTGDVLAYCQAMHNGKANKQPRRDPAEYKRAPIATYDEMPEHQDDDNEPVLPPPDGPAARLWDVIRADLRLQMTDATYQTHFAQSHAIGRKDGVLIVETNNASASVLANRETLKDTVARTVKRYEEGLCVEFVGAR